MPPHRRAFPPREIPPTRIARQGALYTTSLELATLALVLARRELEALGYDPQRLQLTEHISDPGGPGASALYNAHCVPPTPPTWGLVWVSRIPHPLTGVRGTVRLYVDWDTLEIIT